MTTSKKHPHPAGQIRLFRTFDALAPAGGRERDQLVLVTGHDEQGRALAKPLGWADEGAAFEPGQLREVGAEVQADDDGGGDGGGG